MSHSVWRRRMYVVSYDITSDRLRNKIAKTLGRIWNEDSIQCLRVQTGAEKI